MASGAGVPRIVRATGRTGGMLVADILFHIFRAGSGPAVSDALVPNARSSARDAGVGAANARRSIMMPNIPRIAAALFASTLIAASVAHAGLTTYTDRDAWFEAVSPGGSVPITTIGFSEFPIGTNIRDQYAHLGVNFDGNNFTLGPDHIAFPQDGWALRSGIGGSTVEFDAPRHALALDHPGDSFMELFHLGEQIATIDFDGSGFGQFSGIVSTEPFDKVILSDRQAPSFIDDLHFVSIPAPGALLVLLGASLLGCRTRHRAA